MSVLRPETSDDRSQQKALVERVAAYYGGIAQHMRRFAPFDAYLLTEDGERYLGVIEVKRRSVPWARYSTIPIEVEKVRRLRQAAAPFDAPTWHMVLGIEWGDGVVGVLDATHAEGYPTEPMTLRHPRDENDKGDLCFTVPVKRFHVIKTAGQA